MVKVSGHPASGGMAFITLYVCFNVSNRFGAGTSARAMAAVTDTGCGTVMDPAATDKGGGAMTGTTVELGGQVCWAGIVLAGVACTTVDMTGVTSSGTGN